MTTYHMNDVCPHCSYTLNRVSEMGASTGPPGVGDFTVCFNCGSILIFISQDGKVRQVELLDLSDSKGETLNTLKLIQSAILRRGRLQSQS